MIAERRLPSSLTRLIAGMVDPGWADEQAALAERAALTRKIIVAGDWSATLQWANDLAALARSGVARQNSSKTEVQAVEAWRQRLGVDPIKLFALSVLLEHVCRQKGMARIETSARKVAIQVLRPDLKQQGDPKSIVEARRARERQALFLKFKGMVDRPPKSMKASLDQVRADLSSINLESLLQKKLV